MKANIKLLQPNEQAEFNEYVLELEPLLVADIKAAQQLCLEFGVFVGSLQQQGVQSVLDPARCTLRVPILPKVKEAVPIKPKEGTP